MQALSPVVLKSITIISGWGRVVKSKNFLGLDKLIQNTLDTGSDLHYNVGAEGPTEFALDSALARNHQRLNLTRFPTGAAGVGGWWFTQFTQFNEFMHQNRAQVVA